MKNGQKPNANEAQLLQARHDGMDKTMVFCLYALYNKMGFDRDKLIDFIKAVVDVADSITKGYAKYKDIYRVLVEEQGLEW